jgi:hypothetical protein
MVVAWPMYASVLMWDVVHLEKLLATHGGNPGT